MEKARVATFAVVSAWTSSKSSYCLWFTPIICGHPPRSKPEFCAERFRAQPSQGTGEFLLLKRTSCFVVSLHLRLTPSSWPEVLVQVFRLSFPHSTLSTDHPRPPNVAVPISALTKAKR